MKKLFAALLAATLIVSSLSACGGSNQKYRTVGKALATERLAIAFREGDKLLELVDAAIKVLTAGGFLSQLSEKWFGSDLTVAQGDIEALLAFEHIPERDFIMGFNPNSAPMSYKDDSGSYAGFDIELASRICELLNWELKLSPIEPAKMETELKSGNVDCVFGYSATGEADVSASGVYIENELVFVVPSDSKIRFRSSLNGKTLAIPADPFAAAALDADEKLKSGFASIKPLAAVDNCFNALDEGLCDVILTDSIALIYYSNVS